MTRLRQTLLRCLIFLLLFVYGKSYGQSSPPNIVFVLSDDHSAPYLGCYGDPVIQTPNLDNFAREGIRFSRAYVASPQCVPSRASLMTGRSPVAVDMTRFSAPLPAAVISFPEQLRSGAGYYTGIMGRSYHLDGSGRMPEETRLVFDQYNLRTFPNRVDYLKNSNQNKVLAELNEFLDKRPKNKPFFVQVGFNDPHRPFDTFVEGKRHDPKKLKLPPHFPDTEKLREDYAGYYDEIAHLDQEFGRVLQILSERGLTANTAVIFMGDNGGALLRGKGSLYELGVKVPLIIRWPGVIKPNTTSEELISGEDIAPTLLALAGLTASREMTGQSFKDLLQGKATFAGRTHLFSERGAHGSGLPTNTAAFDLSRCVITRSHKLIYNALWQLPYSPVDFDNRDFWKDIQAMHTQGKLAAPLAALYFPPTRPMFELYDLQQDSYELTNLAGKPELAATEKKLKALLQEWMILNRDYLPLPVEK